MLKSTPSVLNPMRYLVKCNQSGVCRSLSVSSSNESKQTSKQGKILGKLFGSRVAGSKKRWYPDFGAGGSVQAQLPSASNLTNTKKQGKNATRRVTVLNKLFMKYITDMLATGEISPEVVGKGLEISRVKVAPDFQGVNVYWIAKGDTSDDELDAVLKRSAGLIRHELSQLRLMGEVPRIHFVKDKVFANSAEVENLLRRCDFGEEYEPLDDAYQIRQDLGIDQVVEDIKPTVSALPEMRHDILGLDHREIMLKILAKTKKSKLAWEMHEKGIQVNPEVAKPSLELFKKTIEKSTSKSADFQKFLNQRKSRKESTTKIQNEGLLEYYREIRESQSDDYSKRHEESDYIDEYDGKK